MTSKVISNPLEESILLDHLVYGTPDLAGSLKELESLTGVTPAIGGSHPGFGTKNALLDLGNTSYLEIIGPDPDAPKPGRPRPFGIDDLMQPRLVTWAIRVADPERAIKNARAIGHDTGPLIDASRAAPDGTEVKWKLTYGNALKQGSLLPFLIDWLNTPHPTTTTPVGCTLLDFSIASPDAPHINEVLEALGLEPLATVAEEEQLIAQIDTPKGKITFS